jgi:hypothetical protein
LRNLSVCNENKSKIVAKGALPRLFALVRSPNENIQEHAAVSLRNLSVNPDNESKIVAEGGLPPLLAMLRCEHLCERICVGARMLPRVCHWPLLASACACASQLSKCRVRTQVAGRGHPAAGGCGHSESVL